MPISSNINQANLDAQTRALNEQEAQRSQASSQDFSSNESQKTRDYDLKKYNLATGDKFLDSNVAVSFDEGQRSQMSDVLAVTYSQAQEELLAARNLITSGDTLKRIEGQTRMTKANNSLKKLGEEMMILDQDTEESANSDMIPDANSDLIKTIYKNNVEGTTKVVTNAEAKKEEGDENQGRYIQYKDEDGSDKYISVDAYQKILKGVTSRQDDAGWVDKISKVLKADESYRGKSIEGKSEAVNTYVDNYLSDPKVLRALEHQYGVKGKEGVAERLSTLLGASLNENVYRAPTSSGSGRALTPSQADEANAASQRNYDLTQALSADKNTALNWLNTNLASKASKYGSYQNKVIANNGVSFSGNNIKLQFEDGSTREIPYEPEQVNNLLNEVVYTLDDARSIPYSKAGASQPKNFGGVFGTTTPSAVTTDVEAELTNVIDAATNKTSIVPKGDLDKFVDQIYLKFPDMAVGGLEVATHMVGSDKVKFQGKEYDVTKRKADVEALKTKLNTYIKTLRGNNAQATNVGSKYNK